MTTLTIIIAMALVAIGSFLYIKYTIKTTKAKPIESNETSVIKTDEFLALQQSKKIEKAEVRAEKFQQAYQRGLPERYAHHEEQKQQKIQAEKDLEEIKKQATERLKEENESQETKKPSDTSTVHPQVPTSSVSPQNHSSVEAPAPSNTSATPQQPAEQITTKEAIIKKMKKEFNNGLSFSFKKRNDKH